MINSANAAAIFFAAWFGLSIFAAPIIGKMLAGARRRERAVCPEPTPSRRSLGLKTKPLTSVHS